MNYTELVAAIPAYLNNSSAELAAQLDTIIRIAENRVLRDIDLRAYRMHATAVTTASDPYLTLPDNVLSIRYLRLRAGEYLEYRAESFMSEYNKVVTTAGTPKYYGHWDDAVVVLAPAPNGILTVELSYKVKPASIVTASTTWLGDNAEDVLLYACLIEAGIYVQALPETLGPLMDRYKTAKESLEAQERTNASDEFMTRATI